MADIRGFRGFRYDLGSVGTLSDVVAPPYDVIDPALQQKLYDSSPYNAIRLELTRDEPGDDEQTNKYTRAGNTLREWVVENAVRQDTARGLYVYEQEYTVEGQTFVRRGFLARVRLEPFGSGKIYPHEQTMSGPKEDRLKLYRATGSTCRRSSACTGRRHRVRAAGANSSGPRRRSSRATTSVSLTASGWSPTPRPSAK